MPHDCTRFWHLPAQIPDRIAYGDDKERERGVRLRVLLGLSKTSTNSTLNKSVNSSHAGFSSSSGESAGLLNEWRRRLQNSVISRSERKGNSRAGSAGSTTEVESSIPDEVDTVAIPHRDDASSPRTAQYVILSSCQYGILMACSSVLLLSH